MIPSNIPTVFITHSWTDIDFARRLYNDLKNHGYQVWMDEKTLPGGGRLAEEIYRGLEKCDVYMPILSPDAVDSPWCREEISAAISLSNEKERRGHPLVLPVIARNCQVPAMLRTRKYIDLTEHYEAEVVAVYSAIDAFGLESERKQRGKLEHDLAKPLTNDKSEQAKRVHTAKPPSKKAQLPKTAQSPIKAEPTQEQVVSEPSIPEKIAEPQAQVPRVQSQSETLFTKLRNFFLLIVLGNVASGIIIAYLAVSHDTNQSISYLLVIVFALAGLSAAMLDKETASHSRTLQPWASGFLVGVLCCGPLLLWSIFSNIAHWSFIELVINVIFCPIFTGVLGAAGGFGSTLLNTQTS